MKKHLLYGVVLGLFMPYITFGQRMLGVSTDNWSSTRQLYLNPAAIADQRNRFTVDLFSVNAGFDNNLAGIAPGKAVNSFSGDSVNVNDFLSFTPRDRFNMVAPSLEVRGPGVLVSLHKNHTIALTTRIRAMNQMHGFSQKFYRSLTDIDFGNADNNYALSTGKFDWSVHMWSEVGLSYAATVWSNDAHRLKAGGTIRYLGGIGYLNINCRNVDVSYFGTYDSIQVKNTDIAVSSNMIGNEDILSEMSDADMASRFFGKRGASGIGGDIGLIYEFSGEPAGSGPTDYLLRVSASVVDIGRINYKDNNETAYLRGHGALNTREIGDRVTNFTEFKQYVRERGVDVDTSTAITTVMQLPTALIVGADYYIRKSFYINTLFIGNLVNRYKPGNSVYNQLTVTPRYETKLLTVALPITYSTLTGTLKTGLGVRVSGFFFGSDDIPVLGNRKYGFNFYFGACVPFYKKRS